MSDAPGTGPTWYDVLGLDRDADAAQVRAAWREATDAATPGSSRFRSANQAYETLLDPARRAAYDAQLDAAEREAAEQEAAEQGEAAPPPAHDTHPDAPEDERLSEHGRTEPRRRLVGRLDRVPTLVLAALAVLVVGLLVAVAVLAQGVAREAAVADATQQATVAAEEAAAALLAYDYRQLPQDRERAVGFLTGDFEEEFVANFDLLEEQEDGSEGLAVQSKTVTTAQVKGSGVVAVAEDGGSAEVLVFVDQTSEKEGQDPQVFLNRVVMTLQEQDGRWLVSDLRSY